MNANTPTIFCKHSVGVKINLIAGGLRVQFLLFLNLIIKIYFLDLSN